MEKISREYRVSLGDFRMASYYALAVRNKVAFRIAIGALCFGLCYLAAAAFGILLLHPVILFVAAAYLVWVLIMLAQEELHIRSYVRSKDCLIGLQSQFFMEGNRIRIRIPKKNITADLTVNRLVCAIELSRIFLLYSTPENVYLVPKRVLSEAELRSIRSTLRKQLPGRFTSRY